MTVLLRRLAWNETTSISPGTLNAEVQNIVNHWNRHNAGLSQFDTIGINGDIKMKATAKFFPDGGGDTFFQESSANVWDFTVGNSLILSLQTTTTRIQNCDFAVDATKKIFIDGGGNTHITESSADTMDFTTNNVLAIRITSGQIFDYRLATVALGGGAAATLGTIGGSGPGTAAQNSWIKIKVAGTDSWIPIWR